MSEAEARKKWCPFALAQSSISATAVNRDPGNPNATRCLGSDCMAWLPSGHCGLVLRQQVSVP
jgi:hypothetical protein